MQSTHGKMPIPPAPQKLRIGYEFGIVIILAVSLLSFKQIYDYSKFVQASSQVEFIRAELQNLELKVREAEALQASYLNTGKANYIDQYNRVMLEYGEGYQRLRGTLSQAGMKNSLNSVVAAGNKKFEFMTGSMKHRGSGVILDSARRIASDEDGANLMMNLQEEIRKFSQGLRGPDNVREKDLKKSADMILATICVGTLLALILLLLARGVSTREAENFRTLSQILAAGQEELVIANQKVKMSSQAKSEFLANMSHEVRTPLNAITGLSQILARTGLSVENKKLVEGIQKSAQSLLDVINPILDFSKIEHEGLSLQLTDSVDLKDLAEQAVSIMSGQAELKKIQLRLNVRESLGYVRTDGIRLRQVFLNLIGNAIKFTEFGHVEFKVTPTRRDGDQMRVRFEVIDTGVGIPEAAKAKLFQSFTQSDSSISRKYGGTGLGLSISKAIVEKMNGRIGFDSEEGRGTTFWFEIGFEITTSAPAQSIGKQASSEFIPRKEFSHVRALIVEDNRMNQFVLRNFLGEFGCNATVVNSGYEALEAYEKENFDLIFLDVQMPGMDGFMATEKIREIEKSKNHRSIIVATTAHAMSGYKDKCLNVGMDDYLPKPIYLETLHQILARFFPSPKYEMPPAPAPQPSPSSQIASVNEKKWEKLTQDRFLNEMIEIFNTSVPDKMEELSIGLSQRNFELTKEAAHFLKSSSSAMGFDKMTVLLQEMEDAAEKAESDPKDISRLQDLQSQIREEYTSLLPRLQKTA